MSKTNDCSVALQICVKRVREDVYSTAENHRLSPETNRPIQSGQRSNPIQTHTITSDTVSALLFITDTQSVPLLSLLIRDVMKPLTVSTKVECVRHPAAFVLPETLCVVEERAATLELLLY